jgi:hypothetical protein
MVLPMWQYMCKTDHLAIEVHFFCLSAHEVAERSRNLRALFLRGARRLAQQNGDCGQRAGSPEAAEGLHIDLVGK